MKKITIISLCVAICLLFAACESKTELPPVDNTTPAEALITTTYSDADLAAIGEKYEGLSIYELAEDFKIECIRDPREFCENYLPYIVLMSDSGKRAFVYYGNEAYSKNSYHHDVNNIYFCLFVDKFKSYDEMNKILQNMADKGTTWEAVIDNLVPYGTGLSSTSKGETQCVAVKEGVFVTFIHNSSARISRIIFYPDGVIFGAIDTERDYDLTWTIKPLLTIDKDW